MVASAFAVDDANVPAVGVVPHFEALGNTFLQTFRLAARVHLGSFVALVSQANRSAGCDQNQSQQLGVPKIGTQRHPFLLSEIGSNVRFRGRDGSRGYRV